MRFPASLFLPVICSLFLVACGGSESSDSGINFSVNQQSFEFTASQYGAMPFDQELEVSWDDSKIAGFAFVFTEDNPQPEWLDFSTVMDDTSPAVIDLEITTTSLSPGTYEATLPLYSGDINANPLSHIDISVTFVVTEGEIEQGPINDEQEKPTLSLSSTVTSLQGLHGADIASTSVILDTTQNVATDWQVSTDASWVAVDMDSGTTPSTVTVSVDPDHYPFNAGTYSANLTFSSAYSTVTLRANLILTPVTPTLSVDHLSFSGINGTAFTSQSFDVDSYQDADGFPWVASSNADWLLIGKAEGVIPDTVTVSVDPGVTPLASGTHRGEVTVAIKGVSRTLSVYLSLEQPELSIPTSLLIGGDDGLSGQTSETMALSLNTSDNAYPWTITENSEWLTLSKNSGEVSSEGTAVTAEVDSDLTPGTYTAQATATAVVNGDTVSKTVDITYNLERKRLFIADNGVALIDLPSVNRLTHAVTVKDSEGDTVAWQASTEESWLTVTASGQAGDLLELSADSSGLTAGQFYLAEVSVSAQDTDLTNTEVIRVGLWVNDVAPEGTVEVATNYKHIEADPVRPLVYANNGDGDIDVYNIYSGQLVDSISVGSVTLADMVASTDGRFLYVVNGSGSSIIRVDLDAMEYESFALAGINTATLLEYGRISATGFLYLSGATVLNAQSMEAANLIGSLAPAYSKRGVIEISKNGNKVCHLNQGISPYSLYCANVKETALGTQGVKYTNMIKVSTTGSNGSDLAVNHDGSRVFVASGSPYSFYGYELTDTKGSYYQSLPGDAYPNNVEIGDDETLYAAASVWYGSVDGEPDYWEYNWRTGEEYSSAYLSSYADSILSRQLVVSGDSQRTILLVDAKNVKMIIRSTRLAN